MPSRQLVQINHETKTARRITTSGDVLAIAYQEAIRLVKIGQAEQA